MSVLSSIVQFWLGVGIAFCVFAVVTETLVNSIDSPERRKWAIRGVLWAILATLLAI